MQVFSGARLGGMKLKRICSAKNYYRQNARQIVFPSFLFFCLIFFSKSTSFDFLANKKLLNQLRCKHAIFQHLLQYKTISKDRLELPTLLHLPFLLKQKIRKLEFNRAHTISLEAACRDRSSLLFQYHSLHSTCHIQPYAPHLRMAIKKHISINGHHPASSLSKDVKTLTVVVESDGSKENMIDPFSKILSKFKNIVIIILMESKSIQSVNMNIESLVALIKRFKLRHIIVEVSPEELLVLSSETSNLLVHSGQMSALAALTSTGNVFYTPSFRKYIARHEYRHSLNNVTAVVETPIDHPIEQLRALNAFKPRSSCCSFEYLGSRREEKAICTNAKNFAVQPCWIMSVGCRGSFQFEEAMFLRTKCKIHIFDCTGSWKVPSHLKRRVKIHKLCIGAHDDPREDFLSLRKLIEVGANATGYPMLLPTLLKFDADGYEWVGFSDLIANDPEFLPDQLAVEVHMMYSFGVLNPYKPIILANGKRKAGITEKVVKQFLSNMTNAGYELVNRVDDLECPVVCSEVSWVKRDKLPNEGVTF